MRRLETGHDQLFAIYAGADDQVITAHESYMHHLNRCKVGPMNRSHQFWLRLRLVVELSVLVPVSLFWVWHSVWRFDLLDLCKNICCLALAKLAIEKDYGALYPRAPQPLPVQGAYRSPPPAPPPDCPQCGYPAMGRSLFGFLVHLVNRFAISWLGESHGSMSVQPSETSETGSTGVAISPDGDPVKTGSVEDGPFF